MTPKKKAKELVDKFIDYAYHWDEGFTLPKEDTPIWNAKQCALICVDEMKELLNNYSADVESVMDKMTDSYFEYFEEVKQEINLLS